MSDETEPELLPCPFCGGRMLFRAALWPSDGNCDGFIHAEATDCPLGGFEDGSSDRSIINKWNARAAIAAVREREGAEIAAPCLPAPNPAEAMPEVGDPDDDSRYDKERWNDDALRAALKGNGEGR